MSDVQEKSDLDADLQLDLNFCGLTHNQEIFKDLSKNGWDGKLAGSEKKMIVRSDDAPNNLFENYLFLDNSQGRAESNFENNYVKIERDIVFDCPKGLTVEVWVKLKRIDGWYYRIFDFGGDLNPKPNTIVNVTIESSSSGVNESERGGFIFYLHRKPRNETNDAQQGQTDPSRIYTVSAPYKSMNLEQWTHLAVVANFEEKSAKFFVNGRLVGENRNVYKEQPYNRVQLSRDNRIGATEKKDSRTGAPLDGGIAHLRLYSRPLSQEEIFKRMAVKLIPALDSIDLANALETLENSALAMVLESIDPIKLSDETLSAMLEKMREEILTTRKDKTWESLKRLFDLNQR